MSDTEPKPRGHVPRPGQDPGEKYKGEDWYEEQKREQNEAQRRAQEIIKQQEAMRQKKREEGKN